MKQNSGTKLIASALLAGIPLVANAETKIGFDYDVSMNWNDQGMSKAKGADDPDTLYSTAQNAYLNASGQINEKDSFAVAVHISESKNTSDAVEVAKATHRFNNMLSLTVGKNLVNQGGLDNWNATFDAYFNGAYTMNHIPLAAYQPMVQVDVNTGTGGTITLQVTDDVSGPVTDSTGACTSNCTNYSEGTQPATLIQWKGDFGAVSPLLQIVPYDAGNSMAFAVGAAFGGGPFSGWADFNQDTRAAKSLTGGDATKDVYTTVTLNLTYDAGGIVPYLKYSSMDVEQDTNLKGNSAAGTYDDNADILGIGVGFTKISDNFAPYISIVRTTSDIIVGTDTETRTEQNVAIGFSGSM